eukprot:scaffold2803_cov347-Prasinococcus_capsulatus_cf.AAC.8
MVPLDQRSNCFDCFGKLRPLVLGICASLGAEDEGALPASLLSGRFEGPLLLAIRQYQREALSLLADDHAYEGLKQGTGAVEVLQVLPDVQVAEVDDGPRSLAGQVDEAHGGPVLVEFGQSDLVDGAADVGGEGVQEHARAVAQLHLVELLLVPVAHVDVADGVRRARQLVADPARALRRHRARGPARRLHARAGAMPAPCGTKAASAGLTARMAGSVHSVMLRWKMPDSRHAVKFRAGLPARPSRSGTEWNTEIAPSSTGIW